MDLTPFLLHTKGVNVPLYRGKSLFLDHPQPTTEGYRHHFLSLLFEISSAQPPPPADLALSPVGVLYSALQGWRLVTAFQFGTLSFPDNKVKVLEWLAELLWKMADLEAQHHEMEPVMLMAIVSGLFLTRFVHAPVLRRQTSSMSSPQNLVANPAGYKSSVIGTVLSCLICAYMHTAEHFKLCCRGFLSRRCHVHLQIPPTSQSIVKSPPPMHTRDMLRSAATAQLTNHSEELPSEFCVSRKCPVADQELAVSPSSLCSALSLSGRKGVASMIMTNQLSVSKTHLQEVRCPSDL